MFDNTALDGSRLVIQLRTRRVIETLYYSAQYTYIHSAEREDERAFYYFGLIVPGGKWLLAVPKSANLRHDLNWIMVRSSYTVNIV